MHMLVNKAQLIALIMIAVITTKLDGFRSKFEQKG